MIFPFKILILCKYHLFFVHKCRSFQFKVLNFFRYRWKLGSAGWGWKIPIPVAWSRHWTRVVCRKHDETFSHFIQTPTREFSSVQMIKKNRGRLLREETVISSSPWRSLMGGSLLFYCLNISSRIE